MRFRRYWKEHPLLALAVGAHQFGHQAPSWLASGWCVDGGYTAAKGLAEATDTTAAFVPPTAKSSLSNAYSLERTMAAPS